MSRGVSDKPRGVHRLKDCIGLFVRVGRDFDEIYSIDKPVGKIGERTVVDFIRFIREGGINISIPGEDVAHRFLCLSCIRILLKVQRLHTLDSIFDIDVERALAEFLRKNKIVKLDTVVAAALPVVEVNQQ